MTGVRVARTKLQWFTELRGADLTHAEFRVVTILATYTDAQMDNAFPGLNKLATEAKVRVNTAREALKSLQSKGWIRLTQEGGNQYGKGRANVWSLTIPGEKGVADRTPSTPLKGVADRTPSSRDGHVTTAPALAISESESEGVRSEHEGVRSEHSEGGRSPHPHQVVTIRAENSSGPSAPVSNARERSAIYREKERDFQISRMDQQIPGGFRKGERARARQLLDDGVPVTKILYKHLIPERTVRPARTYPTAQEAQR